MGLTASLYVADLELRHEVVAADRVHAHRASLFLHLADDGAEGWGECATSLAAGPDATADEVAAVLGARVLEVALRARASDAAPSPVTAMVSSKPADVAAAGLVEAALLDLELRRDGRSLASWLGAPLGSVGFGGVVGVEDPGLARARAAELVDDGASRLRVKVAPATGCSAVAAVLDEVHVPVAADANGSFRPGADDAALGALLELPLAWLEQPFAPGNLAAHAELASRCAVPLALDESVRSVRTVRDTARYAAAAIVCCKPSRLGGPARCREVMGEAARLGLRPYVGGYFEAGLGRSVLGALAAADGGDIDGDVASASTYLLADPCGQQLAVQGRQPVYDGPGCGPAPDVGALRLLLRRGP